MQRRLIFLLSAVFICQAWSQTYNMRIKAKDGTVTSFPVQDIRKITFSGLTDVREGKNIMNVVKTFTLLQNYPNPFNPTTTIEYQLSRAQEVELTVFNINGQHIRTVTRSYHQAGTYQTTWDGRDDNGQPVASGAYLYQLKGGQTVLSKKMVFIK